MRPTNWKHSRQSSITDGSYSAAASTNQPSRPAEQFEPNVDVRDRHVFPGNYGMQGPQSYASHAINAMSDLETQNVGARVGRGSHDTAFSQMTDSGLTTNDIYSTTNTQHLFPTRFDHPPNDIYSQFMASQSQMPIHQSPQNPIHPTNTYHQNMQVTHSSQLLNYNRPTVCVCGMFGQSQCICGFADSLNRGQPRLSPGSSTYNNVPSSQPSFAQVAASQKQQRVPKGRQSEGNDISKSTSTASMAPDGRQSSSSKIRLGHPNSIYLNEQPSSLLDDPNDRSWQTGDFNEVSQRLYGQAAMDDLSRMASTSSLYHNLASSSTSSIDIANSQGHTAMDYQSEETRWNAIVRRSHLADSHFVYGAHTTRIYCRPSCASKQPERTKVIYFMFPDAAIKAERAGYRACKRCKPGTQGVADACVLAVGECLRHMTRAAILGESDDVDGRMKKKTLKQYSSDFGVSAFHFHRTLKKVSTMTPGEYGQVCHALVLQDELGIDNTGLPLETEVLQHKLRGWSARRARRALGNVLPMIYASGMLDLQIVYAVAENTPYGCVVAMYGVESRESSDQSEAARENGQISVVGLLIGEDAIKRALLRCPRAICDRSRSEWLHTMINDLHSKGTREVQMPVEVIPWLRRARAYVAVKKAIESLSSQSRTNSSLFASS